MTAPALIECRQVTKRFGAFTAVESLDLRLEPGTVLGFLGPNGAGKSTTIRMLLGLSAPTKGSVSLFGEDPLRCPQARARVGYSPGELRLDERLTVKTTLASWARLRGGGDTRYRDELLERLGLRPDAAVRDLSTGNRRKLALVGALMSRPELLVLDEPTNGLDPLVQHEFMALLDEATANGASVLLSSHILREVERIAQRVVVIRGGKLVAEGPTETLRHRAAQEFRIEFGTAPPANLRSLDGISDVQYISDTTVSLSWTGPVAPLLQLLAQYEVRSLVAPEPDLETAFMSYYRTDSAQGGAS